MKKEDIIINTIVFKESLDKGISQLELLETIHELGFKKVEIRREFLTDISQDLTHIRQKANQLDLKLYYSVNEDLFVDGKVNSELPRLFEELDILEAPFIKLNTGSAKGISPSTWEELKRITAVSKPIKVENNQDPINARIKNCQKIMEEITQHDLPISFVFDTANWVFVGDEVDAAISALGSYTSYLHCKNYTSKGKGLALTNLFNGDIDMLDLMSHFPKVSCLALEYPSSEESLLKDVTELLSR